MLLLIHPDVDIAQNYFLKKKLKHFSACGRLNNGPPQKVYILISGTCRYTYVVKGTLWM